MYWSPNWISLSISHWGSSLSSLKKVCPLLCPKARWDQNPSVEALEARHSFATKYKNTLSCCRLTKSAIAPVRLEISLEAFWSTWFVTCSVKKQFTLFSLVWVHPLSPKTEFQYLKPHNHPPKHRTKLLIEEINPIHLDYENALASWKLNLYFIQKGYNLCC